GKETVQNILVFRFGNGIFEPIWNRRYIACVQITAAEKVGVEQRGGYYEGAGALRDMVPNHLLQLVTLTAMEPPISFEADAVRDTQIAIQFRRAPFMLFRNTPVERLSSNRLVLHIQPDEGISLRFGAKVPGPTVSIGAVDMDFDYEDYFGDTPSTGYERLLHDCMVGDATLFQRADQVEAGWSVVAPIQKAWKAASPPDFPNYKAGSCGPTDADELLRSGGSEWEETQDVRQNRLR